MAMAGVTAVIHLGGLSDEADWETILAVNVRGTNAVFEAAREAGVGRVVYASSNHAVGYRDYADGPLPDGLAPLPDSFYGASKAFGEALGGLYHHRYGMDVVCLRIGSCFDLPTNARMLETWLSPDDAGRLFAARCPTGPVGTIWCGASRRTPTGCGRSTRRGRSATVRATTRPHISTLRTSFTRCHVSSAATGCRRWRRPSGVREMGHDFALRRGKAPEG